MEFEPPPTEMDDAELVRRIADRQDYDDVRALDAHRTLIERYAPRVTGYVRAQFGLQLRHPEIEQVVNDAGMRLWTGAETFDPAWPRGFGPWFLTIAHRCALDLLKGEGSHASFPEGQDPRDTADDETVSPQTEWRLREMDRIIELELKGFEQIVARADAAAGGSADSLRLAQQNGKTLNDVYATRSKVRKKIHDRILERESQRQSTRGTT